MERNWTTKKINQESRQYKINLNLILKKVSKPKEDILKAPH
jgi:hypothetical protein